jgi:DNA-binding MarR family transcriptional regulator
MSMTRRTTVANVSSGTSPVEDTIDYKIGRLRKALDNYSSAEVSAKYGLTLPEWRVLSHIHVGATVTAGWLCQRLLVDKAEVSRACASLVGRGFVSTRRNPADARSQLMTLTAAGRNLYARLLPERLQLDAQLSAVLTARERKALCHALDKLTTFVLRDQMEIQDPSRQ